ncbi:tripeptidyl-peptidase 2 [Adelges cooleyi]|uniref:tripeptidyl-peptidase 2 n=1 Tax=Adelges cooleyi TaxID=133065 RepID=UPI00218055CC|nr:tripeptidyl-peptidase 2 [Adelges cooleyi]
MSAELGTEAFPVSALVPKKETGVTNFLTKYPTYDGRDVTIAVFDSGVDPGAPGLRVTSEGKPKVIARYDCSGAGDVDTSTVVKPEGKEIKGLSGRTLVIPSDWKNPSGEYHIGIKNAYELYTKGVQKRIEEEKKEKDWDPTHKPLVSKSILEQTKFNNENDGSKVPLSRSQKLTKDDLDNTVEALQNLEKKYKSITPVYDCVVFYNGKQWVACLDTSEKGDLAQCKLMGEFSEDPLNNYDYITESDCMSYSFNIYNDGNLLEIVSLGSSHGTHVSAIAAGCYPDEPEKNGIAPGAQIVSLTIGDSRLETMETGTAIVRAMIKVMELRKKFNIEVINMSYGEHSNWSNAGRIGDLMNEVVDKHGVTWVASAGNHGPALCTIGAPPDISKTTIIGVGAYVSPEMMAADYSLLNKLPGSTYTWSSRGPTIDGGRGVSVCAPGGAIASVPGYLLRGTQLMSGTSMACPHVTGSVALLISGLKSKEIETCPYFIKRALENTAQYQDKVDYFSQGHGLLKVEKSFEYLCGNYEEQESYVKFIVSCGAEGKKGIHMRNAIENITTEHSVNVEPIFLNETEVDAQKKINFQISLCLVCDAPWVQVPTHLELMYMSRNFSVKVTPSGLPDGVHTSTVRAYDTNNTRKGPVFTFEVTVVRPTVPDRSGEMLFENVPFEVGTIKRHFILVPRDVTWASVHVKNSNVDTSANFWMHAVQLLPQKSCKARECYKMFNMKSNDFQAQFIVEEDVVLEFVLAKYWSSSSNMNLTYKLNFRGVVPLARSLTLYHGMGLQSLMLRPGLRNEEIQPSISLKHLSTVLKPTEGKITVLSLRDIIPPQRPIYQLNLSYTFSLIKATDVYVTCGLFGDLLYECEYESQLWMIFDANKQYITSGDAYSSRHVYKLDKGEYNIKMHVRHERKELLDKISELQILLVQKLQNSLTLDVYSNHYQASIFGKKCSTFVMTPSNDLVPLYFGCIPNEKLVSLKLTAGQCLNGNIVFVKDENGKKVDYYTVKYVITDTIKSKPGPKPIDENKSKLEEFKEAVCDVKANWLTKFEYGPESISLYDSLAKKFGDKNSSVHTSWIQCIEPDDKRKFPNCSAKDLDCDKLNLIVSAADRVLSIVNQNELLAYYGIKSDQRTEAFKFKTANDKLKNNLVEALCRKGTALCQLYYADNKQLVESKQTLEDISLEAIDDIWLQVTRFISPDSDLKSFNYFNLWHGAVYKHYGRVMKILLKMLDDKNIKEIEQCLLWAVKEQFGENRSKHLVDAISSALIVHYPKAYRPF